MNIRPLLKFIGGQDCLRFGVRDRVIRWFHDPDTCASEEFVVPFFGAQYRGNFSAFIDWSVFYYGAYSREELRLMADVLETLDSSVIFDVGANVGHHTLFAALQAELVYAFEPLPDVSLWIERKIADNNLTNVRLCRFGLGAKSMIGSYIPPKGHNTGTGSFARMDETSDALNLPIKNGDEFVEEQGIEGIGFIKIDTEGYEPQVLEGLSKTLLGHRPVVFFEWTQDERKGDKITSPELFPADYCFFQFIPDKICMGVFRKLGYRLKPLGSNWSDGNILALPKEYVERVLERFPSSAIASCLGGRSMG